MFYLGLVTMKEMSPKQWAKAAGTQSPARGTENWAADAVLALESVQCPEAEPCLWGLLVTHGDFLCPSWFGRLTVGHFLALVFFPSLVKACLVLRSKGQSGAQVFVFLT